tara:strand:- start:662 stop:2620 length:1959 start_codon:yes stop_codon:yes gene_type:complete
MASLKDINATIEEGNEDLEKLNQNFSKWFESQKKGGDDLESAAEARTKKGKSGGIIKAAATGAAVSKMAEKDGMSKYLKYALPLALPILWKFSKEFLTEKRFDLNQDGKPDLSVADVGVGAAALYGAKKFSNVGTRIGERLARAREVKLNLANTKAFNSRLAALEIQSKVDEDFRKLEQKRLRDILKAQKALTQIPKGTTTGLNIPANFNRPPVSTQTMSQSLANANKPAANTNIPKAANTNTPVTNTKARSSSAFKKFLNRTSSLNKLGGFDSIKRGMSSVTNTGSKLIKGVMPTPQNFGKNAKAYIKALTAWAQTMNPGATAKKVGMLLLKVIAKLVFPVTAAASIGAWAVVMFGQKDGVTGKLISYSPDEKIAATGQFIGGWTGFGIGAAIGAAIGANALGIGALPGAVIGGIFGALSGAELAEILFLWAARKNREMKAAINAKKAVLMGEGLFQTDPAFANIGGKDSQGRNMFQAFAGSDNVIRRDDFNKAKPFIPTTAGSLIPKMQMNADMIGGYTAMAASRSKAARFVSRGRDYRDVFLGGADILANKGNVPDFVRGISGGGFSTAPNANSIQTLGTAGMEAQRLANSQMTQQANANVVANSGNTNTSVNTTISGGNGVRTIDTEMARRMHSYQMIGGIVSGQRAY